MDMTAALFHVGGMDTKSSDWVGAVSSVLLLFEGAHPAVICESVPRGLPLSVKTNDNKFDNCNCLHTPTIINFRQS